MTGPSPVGVRMCEAREKSGKSRYQVALEIQRLTGAKKASLAWPGHVEKGLIKSPRAELLGVVAQILDVELKWLATGVGPMKPRRRGAAA